MKTFILLVFCACISIASFCQNIVQAEYFVDSDLGYGKNSLVTVIPSQDNSFGFNIDLSSYNPGYHKLYFRTKDSDGRWGITLRRNIEILLSQSKTSIVRGEYFVDADPGFGMAMPIGIVTLDSLILQNFSAVATNLSEGFHKLYGRFEDNFGRWSLTFRRNLEIYKSDNNNVLNGEYFFKTDQGFGSCTPVPFTVPGADGSFLINIPRNTIPSGADTLFIRVRDDIENRWSITQIFNSINAALPLTLLDLTATRQNALAQVNWKTTNEINTSHFNIQRSIDGMNFTTIGIVNAKAGGSLQNNYSYSDDITNLKSGYIYYRLQMVDNDGKFTYSKVVHVTVANSPRISIYPNPAHSYFIISNDELIDTRFASILVKDMIGRIFIRQEFNKDKEQKIDINRLSRGIYIISIIIPGNVHTQKLVVE